MRASKLRDQRYEGQGGPNHMASDMLGEERLPQGQGPRFPSFAQLGTRGFLLR